MKGGWGRNIFTFIKTEKDFNWNSTYISPIQIIVMRFSSQLLLLVLLATAQNSSHSFKSGKCNYRTREREKKYSSHLISPDYESNYHSTQNGSIQLSTTLFAFNPQCSSIRHLSSAAVVAQITIPEYS